MKEKFKPILEPFTLPNGVTLNNRLVMAPMTNFASNPDGSVSDQELRYYARRTGGLGMVITAVAYVIQGGKAFHDEIGADRDELIPGLAKLASSIKETGAKAILQIFHGGRNCPPVLVPNGDIVSASNIPAEAQGNAPENPVPRPLTEEEILDIIRAFGEATRRAIAAGFDGVEIHGANGYLIQQFYSPHSNRREDRWGGSKEKRLAFPLAIIEEVKKTVAQHASSSFIVGYRFSPEEPETPGLTMADALYLVDRLADQGLHYLHVSLMEYHSKARRGVKDTRSRLELIRETAGDRVPIIGVGSVRMPDDALAVLETGIPLVAIGRELIIEPDWVQKMQDGRESDIRTTLDTSAQEELVVPDYLWNTILTTPGWFPGVE